jgi:hypothetical protein
VDVPEEAKSWIAEQRLMHGLLRALHTADAPAREGRIATLLERIDQESRLAPRRQWVRVLAAALVLACVGVWFALPPSLPTAHAAVERAVRELARDVNRRFRIEVLGVGQKGAEGVVVTRPGNHFRLDVKVAWLQRMIEVRFGCDGESSGSRTRSACSVARFRLPSANGRGFRCSVERWISATSTCTTCCGS